MLQQPITEFRVPSSFKGFAFSHAVCKITPRGLRMQSRLSMWVCVIVAGTARAELDFNRDVRPILSDKCFSCHGPDEKHRKAKLRFDVEKDAKNSGVFAKGDASTFIARITTADSSEQMPPPKAGKPLSAKEIAILKEWVAGGAKYAPHWAYVPPVRVVPPKVNAPTANDIDHFILARLAREQLTPAPPADARTLVRRVYFDLLGLPPTPDAIDAFINDQDEHKYGKLVDRLLANEHFGERLAMYWLDLVRYADTVGYHGDQDHHASPYRDYVIDAFNLNLPFDRFTREQLAGDLLPSPTIDQKIATCYNRLLQTSHEGGVQPKEYLAIYAADRVRNISSVWMGATVGCAQCHDHKYDPYSTKDFYALAAFFADIDEEKHLRGGGADTVPTKRPPEIPVHTRRERERLAFLEQQIADLKQPTTDAQKQQLATLTKERDALKKAQRLVMVTQAVPPRTTRLLPRGNWLDESGPVVQPAIPAFLGTLPTKNRATRLDLATWLTDAKNGIGGLTARVFVNRMWYLFYGGGLAKSLEDFGGQGEAPVHPELLDALALDFIDHGWDVKYLVKQLVTSHTYRQASLTAPVLKERDPENRLFAHQGRWRLPAESIRDQALFVSGLLIHEVGGASSKPYQPAGFYRHLNFPKREYTASSDAKQWRRGVYTHWQRQYLHPMLKAFDASTREECTAQRAQSNTPLAALVLLNDPTFIEAARVFAQRVVKEAPDERLAFAFRQMTGRRPDPHETNLLQQMLAREQKRYQDNPTAAAELVKIGLAPVPKDANLPELATWTSMGRLLLNLSEILTRE